MGGHVHEQQKTILDFIRNFRINRGEFEDSAEGTVIRLFRAGYCWHFAQMLKITFSRGEVCWTAPFGHFVWVDTDGTPYDIEGEYCGEALYLIPEYYITRPLDDFKHIPGQIYGAKRQELITIMKRYCHEHKIPYDDTAERWLKSER